MLELQIKNIIRKNSFYDNLSSIPIIIITRICFHYFTNGHNAKQTFEDLYNLGIYISYYLVRLLYTYIRGMIDLCVEEVINTEKLTGEVEVDES